MYPLVSTYAAVNNCVGNRYKFGEWLSRNRERVARETGKQ